MLVIPVLLEVFATLFGLAYVILAAKKNIWCWLMGIIGSCLSIYLFWVYSKLYAEAILSFYYVVTGVIGWVYWNKPKAELPVLKVSYIVHLLFVGIGVGLSFAFYSLVTNIFTDAARPLLDSFTTVFSFLATLITIKKWVSNWIYWIVIDAVTAYMYWSRDLNIYSGLMILYTGLAIYGYLQWRKSEAKTVTLVQLFQKSY